MYVVIFIIDFNFEATLKKSIKSYNKVKISFFSTLAFMIISLVKKCFDKTIILLLNEINGKMIF